MSDKIDSARVSGLPGADVVKATLNNLSEQVSQAGATVASAAVAVADDAQSRVASLADEAKDRVASATDSFKSEFASGIDAVGQAMHRAGGRMDGHPDWVAQLIEHGATELGTLADTLRTNDLQGLLGKLEDLARRQPAVFVGAAIAAGFATTRIGRIAVAGAEKTDLPHMPEVHRESI